MNTYHYIAVDLGAESGRVMLATLDHGRLSLEEVHRFPNGATLSADGSLRWNLAGLWDSIQAGLTAVAARGLPIASVSVDSWGVDYVLMDAGPEPIAAPFSYRDLRTEATFRAALEAYPQQRIFERTGIQFMPINTFYQLLAENAAAPAQLHGAQRFLLIADWVHYKLSGRAAQEASNASTTQLFDPVRFCWVTELIEHFELPPHIFPEVVPSCTRLGPVQPEILARTGLKDVEVVTGCTHDTGAAIVAVPAQGRGWAYLSSGTWSLLGVELQQPLINESVRAANFTNEIGYGGTSRFLKNVVGLWILQECRRQWVLEGQELSYEEITRLAGDAEPLRSLINPNDARFLRADAMPEKVRAFCRETGQPIPESPGQIARCVLESLALMYRQVIETIETLTSAPIELLHIVGGGSKSALLNQFAANSIARPVLAGPVEGSAIGNAMLQAVALGHVDSLDAVREVVRQSFPVERFTPTDPALWAEAYRRFSAL